MQFLGDEEYSNIRSEKIRVLELGISVPTFTPTFDENPGFARIGWVNFLEIKSGRTGCYGPAIYVLYFDLLNEN